MRTNYNNGDEITLEHNNCDGCTPCSVNGVFCHESGCPEAWRDEVRECKECGCDFYPEDRFQTHCDDVCNPYSDEEPWDGFLSDTDADADVLASSGWGTNEDYGGGIEDW